MYLYSVTGTFGAGKTTLIVSTVRAYPGTYAYVLNDDGAEVDGSVAEDAATVVTMTNGCFTCSDEADLSELLRTLEMQGYEGVFIEGFGMVSGVETRSFLEKSGYPFHIFSLLDVEHFERNQRRYGGLVATHMAAATAGVAITRCPTSIKGLEDPALEGVLAFIAEHASGIPITLMSETDVLPVTLWSAKRLVCTDTAHTGCGHHHHPHAHSHHDHDHHHDHGASIIPYSFLLPTDVPRAALEGAVAGLLENGSLLRVKGALGGQKFDAVYGTWTNGLPDERSFITVYASRVVDFKEEAPAFAALVQERPRVVSEAQSHTLLRQDHVNPDETIATIRELIAAVPTRPIVKETATGVRLVTHPDDLQMLKEIARRPSVERVWFPKAIEACIRYWVEVGDYLRTHQERVVPAELAYNQRELGISLTWWARKGESYLPSTLIARVQALRPAEMVAEGVLALRRLNTNPERAYWQSEEIRCAILFGLANKEDRLLLQKAVIHAASLAKTVEQRSQWALIAAEFA